MYDNLQSLCSVNDPFELPSEAPNPCTQRVHEVVGRERVRLFVS